jgi:predicted  nucleic acid-binding Zn-ribbon protein
LISNNLNKGAVDTLQPKYELLQQLKRSMYMQHDRINQLNAEIDKLEKELTLIYREIDELKALPGMQQYVDAKQEEYEQELQKWELSFFGRTFPAH